VGVAGDDAAPQLDAHIAACVLFLELECSDGRRRRQRVERHVDDGGDPARRGRARGGGKSFPLRAPRLVHVHVRVDESGHDHQVAVVDAGRAVRLDGGDALSFEDDGGGLCPVGEDDAAGGKSHSLMVAQPHCEFATRSSKFAKRSANSKKRG
jgi:hypothetical protein